MRIVANKSLTTENTVNQGVSPSFFQTFNYTFTRGIIRYKESSVKLGGSPCSPW